MSDKQTPDPTLPVVHHISEWQHWLHVAIGGAPRSLCGLRLNDDAIPEMGPYGPDCAPCLALEKP